MDDRKSDVGGVSAQPAVVAAWRGKFKIPSRNTDINMAAHVPNMEAWKIASIMPESLCLEMIPRIDVWPESFKSSPPTEHSVALYFFPAGRDESVLKILLRDAIFGDFALKAIIGETELLIFTSFQLPEKLHRFQGNLYLWGIFREYKATSYHHSEYQSHIQNARVRKSLPANSGNDGSFKGSGNQINISSLHGNPPAKVEKRGRRLDNAWEHAKPLDELRQKAECRYCGFVSSHGGISRLKAHLAGGHPKIRLPGCHKVSREVQEVMANWFSEWVKNTKALWTKEIKEPVTHVHKEGKPHDIAWQDSKSPDIVAWQKTDSNHQGIFSLHLGGNDAKIHMQACPTVSPEIKGDASAWLKKSSSFNMKNKSQEAGAQADRRGRPLDDAWEHAKSLDEARQKTQCNYCGFVSPYGGISRLKAHLGGGCPQLQLQGCPTVPLEVKCVMEQWFNEWAKNSTAIWTRKYPYADTSKTPKRERPLDDTWEHAIPLDETSQSTRCKYCGFVSNYGGIARLRAHLGGGDLSLQVQGCPNVPPEVKSSMAKAVKSCRKKSKKNAPMEAVGEVLQRKAYF